MLTWSSWLIVLFKYSVSKYSDNLFYWLLRGGIKTSDCNIGFVNFFLQIYWLLLHVSNAPRMVGFSSLACRDRYCSQLVWVCECPSLFNLFKLFSLQLHGFLMCMCWPFLSWIFEGDSLWISRVLSLCNSRLSTFLSCKFYLACTFNVISLTQGVQQARPGIPFLHAAWKLPMVVSWGNQRDGLIYFPFQRDHCPHCLVL